MPTTAKKRLVSDPDKLNLCISKLRALFMEVAEKPVLQKIKKSSGGTKEEDGMKRECKSSSITVVMKADFHCDACGSNVLNFVRTLDGVDSAAIGGQKITVMGKVEPEELRRCVEEKTHIKFQLLTPSSTSGKQKNDSKSKNEVVKKSKSSNKVEEKELVTTAVMKMNLHCEGCVQKIRRKIMKSKGFKDMKIDRQKELVTVIGAMDMDALAESLKKHMKKSVEILPPPKAPEKKEKGGGAEKAKKNGGDQMRPANSEGKDVARGAVEPKGAPPNQHNPITPQPALNHPGPHLIYPHPHPHPHPHPILNGSGFAADQFYYYYPYSLHAPQMFSDENPNSCSVM